MTYVKETKYLKIYHTWYLWTLTKETIVIVTKTKLRMILFLQVNTFFMVDFHVLSNYF